MMDIVPGLEQNKERVPGIRVTGMPGKHVPNGVLGAANDFLNAVCTCRAIAQVPAEKTAVTYE